MPKENNLIRYKLFEPYSNLLAFTTTKLTLKNNNPHFTGDNPINFKNNRKNLASLLNINETQLVFPRQTHTKCAAIISSIPERELNETDALITNEPEICLCIQTADCVPILLFDPIKNVIASVHAGWRGTVKEITAIAVNKMIKKYNCRPDKILATIGPSISPGVYEIGEEVISAIEKNVPNLIKALIRYSTGRTHFNLWEANRLILLESGLSNNNIELYEECSFTESDKYFSARRDGMQTGRMVSGIMLVN